MPIDVRNNFKGGLNLDDNYFFIPMNAYIDALNITRDQPTSGGDTAITNIVGNQLVYYNYPVGDAAIIGMKENPVRNTVILFRWNTSGYNGIYEYNRSTNTITKVFESITDSGGTDILGFTETGLITSINIYNSTMGDLLFFIDSLGRPTYMNISTMKAGTYTPVTRNIIDAATNWVWQPPTCVYDNDTTKNANYLLNRLFKFQQVPVFDEYQESCGSSYSAVPLPVNILNPSFTNTITNNNVIRVTVYTGGKNVRAIKLLMSYSEKQNVWNDFQLVETIDKSALSLSDDVFYTFNFYNDSVYPVVDKDRQIQLFDWSPLLANCQEMANGNTVQYAGITEGYNNTLVPNVTLTINTVPAGSGSSTGTLVGTLTNLLGLLWRITFSGTPVTGTTIIQRILVGGVTPTVAATYTTSAGDTPNTVAAAMITSFNALGISQTAFGSGDHVDFSLRIGDSIGSLTITPPAVFAGTNSIATWPFLSTRNIGIAYFDEKGRTIGIQYHSKIVFPAYAENGSQQVLLPYINAKIYHQPPEFAYSYSWAITKDETQFLYCESLSVNISESEYLYFEITLGLNQKKNPTTASVVNWNFQDGDRFRLIRRMQDNNVYNSTFDINIEGIVVEPTINNVLQTGKTFVKVRRVSPFTTTSYVSNFFVFMLYRPSQTLAGDIAPYFEFGETYQILNPTTATRIHVGQVSNQSTDYVTPAEFNFYNGDVYFRQRTTYLTETGFGTFNVQDRNFVDFYLSAVSSVSGRALAIDPNAKQTYYAATGRFSEDIEVNTNINRLNRFKPENLFEADLTWGDIMRMKVWGNVLRVYQKLKIGRYYIFQKLSKAPTGDEILIVTDQLINEPLQYYNWNGGIGTATASLISINANDYLCDNIKGQILKVTLEGVEPISIQCKLNSFSTAELVTRSNIIGGYDQKANNYIISLPSTSGTIKPFGYLDCGGSLRAGFVGIGGTQEVCAREGTVTLVSGLTIILVPNYNCHGGIGCKRYIVSYPELVPYTLTFDEETDTFESFLSYPAEMMCTLGTLLCSAKDGQFYTHDNFAQYNTFYGTSYESYITFVFNENSSVKKSWVGVSEVASTTWDCPEISTSVNSYGTTKQQSNLIEGEFTAQESMPTASFKRDVNSSGGKINGAFLKGSYIKIKFRKADATELIDLSSATVKFNISPTNLT